MIEYPTTPSTKQGIPPLPLVEMNNPVRESLHGRLPRSEDTCQVPRSPVR